jgi:hypothetical protein
MSPQQVAQHGGSCTGTANILAAAFRAVGMLTFIDLIFSKSRIVFISFRHPRPPRRLLAKRAWR